MEYLVISLVVMSLTAAIWMGMILLSRPFRVIHTLEAFPVDREKFAAWRHKCVVVDRHIRENRLPEDEARILIAGLQSELAEMHEEIWA